MDPQQRPSPPQTAPHLRAAPGWPIHPALVTTGLEIPGFRVTASFGVVRGLTVRSAGVLGGVSVAFESIGGGNVQTMIDLCERARAEAFLIMLQHAAQMGANAVIGFRYDTTEAVQGLAEVLAYGTAVWVEPAS